MIRYWGDGTLEKKDGKNNVGGIGNQVFAEFGLDAFSRYLLGNEIKEDYIDEDNIDNKSNDEDKIEKNEPIEQVKPINKKFNDFMTALNDWHFDKKTFIRARLIRDVVCKFIFDSISW